MIRVQFFLANPGKEITGFCVEGHAGLADAGQDILCAAVSSAVYLTANTITDILQVAADIVVEQDGKLSLQIAQTDIPRCRSTLLGLQLHLRELQKQYPRQLKVCELAV